MNWRNGYVNLLYTVCRSHQENLLHSSNMVNEESHKQWVMHKRITVSVLLGKNKVVGNTASNTTKMPQFITHAIPVWPHLTLYCPAQRLRTTAGSTPPIGTCSPIIMNKGHHHGRPHLITLRILSMSRGVGTSWKLDKKWLFVALVFVWRGDSCDYS